MKESQNCSERSTKLSANSDVRVELNERNAQLQETIGKTSTGSETEKPPLKLKATLFPISKAKKQQFQTGRCAFARNNSI